MRVQIGRLALTICLRQQILGLLQWSTAIISEYLLLPSIFTYMDEGFISRTQNVESDYHKF